MKIKYFLGIVMVLLNFCLFSQELYDWDILNTDGVILKTIKDARNVQSSEEGILIEYLDSFSILDINMREHRTYNFQIKPYSKIVNNRVPYYDRKKNKYGYLNSDGEIIISAKYDFVDNFINTFSIIGYGDTSEPPPHIFELSIIDRSGKICSTFTSDFITLSKNKEYYGIAYIYNNYEIIKYSNYKWNSIEINKGKYQFLKDAGDIVIYKKDNKYGFMSWEGKLLTEPIYYSVEEPYGDGSYIVSTNKGVDIFVDSYGEIIPAPCKTNRILGNGIYAVTELEGNVGLYDMNLHKEIISPMYDLITNLNENILSVKKNDRYGYIYIDGRNVGSISYDIVKPFTKGIGIAGIISK